MKLQLRSLFISFLFIALPLLGYSQQSKDSLAENYLTEVRRQIQEKNYAAANKTLKKIYNLKSAVPDEVAFRYGQVQSGLNNPVKAKEAFQKYLQLTGGKGRYAGEAEKMIAESDKSICRKCNNTGWEELRDTCEVCHGKGMLQETCDVCSGKTREFCRVCGGQGVALKYGTMGTLYETCTVCNGKGIVTCTKCKGTGKVEKFCPTCKGKGMFVKRIICDHRK